MRTSTGIIPCLTVAIDRLKTTRADNFALWVTQSPFPGGHVHTDSPWLDSLTYQWAAWQEMFSPLGVLAPPVTDFTPNAAFPALTFSPTNQAENISGRLMQELGHSLWQWVFADALRQTLAQSQGLAAGKNKPLRFRLEIHDPKLIALPWEIMQPEMGQPALSLDPNLWFSRTTSQVAPLAAQRSRESLHILLVLGACSHASANTLTKSPGDDPSLALEQEAAILAQRLEQANRSAIASSFSSPLGSQSPFPPAQVQVTTLSQPTVAELIVALDSQIYNVFFYAGHGMPEANGGILFLQPEQAGINGTELAQVLVRNQITLSVFNTCWGAQPQHLNQSALKRSSLAEVLIHHGVPAVLGMRDAIADEEAIAFIEAFTQALARRMPIDQAIQVARQQLLTLYRFNHPAWTIPILYMHPEFDGELIAPQTESITVLPQFSPRQSRRYPKAALRSPETPGAIWQIYGGLMRVGRNLENDLINPEPWVSQRHAEIICREISTKNSLKPEFSYYLKDFSRFGTLIFTDQGWQTIHHREVPLSSGVQIKFGSLEGQTYEFIVGSSLDSAKSFSDEISFP